MAPHVKRRGLADSVGFAHREHQIEAVVQRIAAHDGARLERIFDDTRIAAADRRRMAIAPHDDFAYAGFMYPLVLRNVAAPVLIIFGVAHKAWQLGLENRLVFDSFTHWRGPYGDIAVSPFRERIMASLSDGRYCVHDEMAPAGTVMPARSHASSKSCAIASMGICGPSASSDSCATRFPITTIASTNGCGASAIAFRSACSPRGICSSACASRPCREPSWDTPPRSTTIALTFTTSTAWA
jgi:hypothetical protein